MNYNKLIDHTLLKANATKSEIIKLCEEAIKYQFCSVCVNPYYVKTCSELLNNSTVKVCTVVGFPLGANNLLAKAYETKIAIKDGADEIDMVINVGALKNKEYDLVLEDIKAVVAAAEGRVVKVIFETYLLTEEEKIKACALASVAQANFVKTSTGFATNGEKNPGATIEDVILMRKNISSSMEVTSIWWC